MQKYASNVQQTNGDALTGASVTVYTDSAHTTKATIYSDNGITQTTNPLTTDAEGEFSFYAADGETKNNKGEPVFAPPSLLLTSNPPPRTGTVSLQRGITML